MYIIKMQFCEHCNNKWLSTCARIIYTYAYYIGRDAVVNIISHWEWDIGITGNNKSARTIRRRHTFVFFFFYSTAVFFYLI